MWDWGRSYKAYVDNLVSLLHRLHLWQKRRGMENRREHNSEGGRGVTEGERGWENIRERQRTESVIWLLRNSTGDSCCYTWSDSLPLQLCRPHAQYDFTTSSLSLEIPFFHTALSTPFSPVMVLAVLSWQRSRCTISSFFSSPNGSVLHSGFSQLEGLDQISVRVMCLSYSSLHSAAGDVVAVITQLITAPLGVNGQHGE